MLFKSGKYSLKCLLAFASSGTRGKIQNWENSKSGMRVIVSPPGLSEGWPFRGPFRAFVTPCDTMTSRIEQPCPA